MEQRTGRIDRINSSCYFDLKKEGKRNFDNSLQVFYPYQRKLERLKKERNILTDILKKEWGFEGIVISYWFAIVDRVKAVKAWKDGSFEVYAPRGALGLPPGKYQVRVHVLGEHV